MEKNIEQQIPKAETILEKHSPLFNPLFTDDNVRRWKANIVQAMEQYASLKVEEERKKLEEKITFWTLEWNKEELKTKEQQSRIEEFTKALEDLRSTYSESISFEDKERIDKLLTLNH